jgi:valyl-tRNA synthetase
VTVAIVDPKRCEHCNSVKITQDEDVLDTWFSSGLWPHSTLGWPLETEDLKYFYPTTVMETGYDIIFFWVARMVMLSMHNMRRPDFPEGEPDPESVPFRHVYLHGLVRDAAGEKMSKSKGNVLDPLELIDQYGCDALRFSLAVGSSPGNDMRLTQERLEGGRNFANKLWNVSRFVMTNLGDRQVSAPLPSRAGALALEDRWILSRLEVVSGKVEQLMDAFQLGEAGRELYDFLWAEFADWYIEMAKVRLRAGDERPLAVLAHVLDQGLRLLHPFMPFVTEEIWQKLRTRFEGENAPVLAIAAFPEPGEAWHDVRAEGAVERVIEVVRAIRNLRAEKNVEAARVIPVVLRSEAWSGPLGEMLPAVAALARCEPRLGAAVEGRAITLNLGEVDVLVPEAGLFDVEAERARLQRELADSLAQIERLEQLLAKPGFAEKAPPHLVQAEREKLDRAVAKLGAIESQLRGLEKN